MTDKEKAHKVADALLGTCMTLEHVIQIELETEDTDAVQTPEFTDELDNTVFCCDLCSWWCEISEESDTEGGCCTDCVPEDEE